MAASVIGVRSLKADAMLYLVGTGIYALSQWSLVVIYARAGGPDAVGLFAIATAIGAPLIALSQMSMRQVLIADVGGRFDFGQYLAARWALSAVAVIAIIATAAVMGYGGTALLTIAGFGLGRAFESVSDIFYARSQAHGGLRRVSMYTGLRGAVTLAVSGGTMVATHNMAVSAAAFALASLACQWLVRTVERRSIAMPVTPPTVTAPMTVVTRQWVPRALLLHSAPLAIAQFLIALTAYAPRLILQHFGGEGLAGQAGVVEYFLSMGLLGVAALGQASSSPIAHAFHGGDRHRFNRLVATVMAGATVLGAGIALSVILFGHWAILALYGPAFTDAADAAVPIIIGGSFGYVASVLGYAVSATGRYERMVGWSVAVLVVTLAGGFVAIGTFGLAGLGYALAASGIVNILAYIHLLRRAGRSMPILRDADDENGVVAHG